MNIQSFHGNFKLSWQSVLCDRGSGKLSAMSLALCVWLAGVFLVWMVVSVESEKAQPVPPSICLVLVSLLVGKVVQGAGEHRMPSRTGKCSMETKEVS